jgi:hypothetical protein
MKNAVFWDVAPCGFNMNRRFGGACRLHLQGERNNASEESANTDYSSGGGAHCHADSLQCSSDRDSNQKEGHAGAGGSVDKLAPSPDFCTRGSQWAT